VLLSGCASTSEQRAVQALKTEETDRAQQEIQGVSYSRARLPDLTQISQLNDYLVYAALNNPQLEAAVNRWKAALEMVAPARTLPDPHFNFGYFVEQVETRVGPEDYTVGISQAFPWFGKLTLRGKAALEGANAAGESKPISFVSVGNSGYEPKRGGGRREKFLAEVRAWSWVKKKAGGLELSGFWGDFGG